MTDQQVTFSDLEDRFGRTGATDLLRCIERMAAIKINIVFMDHNRRLQQALHAMNDNAASGSSAGEKLRFVS